METSQLPSIDILRSCFQDLLSSEPVTLAYLFGSAATGRMTPLSDVDIALVIDDEAIAPDDRLKFELRIEDLIDFQIFVRPLREAFFKRIRERGLHG